MISAEGYKPLTTHLFPKGAPHLDEDAVFGVKESLIQDFRPNPEGTGHMLNYNFVLSQTFFAAYSRLGWGINSTARFSFS